MTGLIDIRCGKSAFEHVQKNGLSPDDIDVVFGASGAAKWLAIYGLDRAIFGEWLKARSKPLDLFGTSVGAFKLAAAAQADGIAAMDRLAESYIEQRYPNGISRDEIARVTGDILSHFLSDNAAGEILSHPVYRYHCGAVLGLGALGSDAVFAQQMGMLAAFLRNGFGRNAHVRAMQRVVFHDPRAGDRIQAGNDKYTSHRVALTTGNLRPAVQASGSIPVVMYGVRDVPDAPPGLLLDGGLLDYHPVPVHVSASPGLVLYPHFYSDITPGWFDKYFAWRRLRAEQLDSVIVISPSQKCLERSKLGRIPDRRDFLKYEGKDDERIALWRDFVSLSMEMGEEFLSLARQGDLASRAQLIV